MGEYNERETFIINYMKANDCTLAGFYMQHTFRMLANLTGSVYDLQMQILELQKKLDEQE